MADRLAVAQPASQRQRQYPAALYARDIEMVLGSRIAVDGIEAQNNIASIAPRPMNIIHLKDQ